MTQLLADDAVEGPQVRRRPLRRSVVLALLAAALITTMALASTIGDRGEAADVEQSPIAASGDELGDTTRERMSIAQVETFERTLEDGTIVLHEGTDATFGEWFVGIRPSAAGLEGGFCTFSNSGGGCRIDPDLDQFGLMFLDGEPIPVVGWGAPAGIETVRVWWDDGRVEDVAVAHLPGESWGLAATIMPASGAGFSYAAVDSNGDIVVERQERPIIPDNGAN